MGGCGVVFEVVVMVLYERVASDMVEFEWGLAVKVEWEI